MNRQQLAHLVRAASTIVNDGEIVVIGSQAVLGSLDADALPEEATLSVEADFAFFDDPDHDKADRVDGALGEYSQFHLTYQYYAQGVELHTAVLPHGWEERLVTFARDDTSPGAAKCLEVHDLVISKLVAGREKDLTFTQALMAHGIVDPALLLARARTVDRPAAVVRRLAALIERCATAAGNGR